MYGEGASGGDFVGDTRLRESSVGFIEGVLGLFVGIIHRSRSVRVDTWGVHLNGLRRRQ